MTNHRLPHSITAAIGALFVSTLFIVAAAGPISPAAASQSAQIASSVQANA